MAPTTEDLTALCAADGEFGLAARHWTGGLRLEIGEDATGFTVTVGAVSAGVPEVGDGVIVLSGPAAAWEPMMLTVPPRFMNDIAAAVGASPIERSSDELLWWQYLPAVQRAIELLRAPGEAADAHEEVGPTPRFDSPVGRYVHLQIDGHDHRVYFEEAGQGIPVLLQHTAGSHGVQWRHLFENSSITDRFRLIAYDMPFHGKSMPPVDKRWWAEQYKLTAEFFRSVPRALSSALTLERPVFMGCSMGGLLALELAAEHPDEFRAVISLEGSLRVGGDWDRLLGFWHPQVSNDTKSRMMEGLTAPTSPDAYRKETIHAYSAGWPQAFLGDLWYYISEYDLTDRAASIDTSQVAVHILSGEYDYSATVEDGRAAHDAIIGSTFTEMQGMGHFPMSEHPQLFMKHLMPVLESIS